MNKIYILLLSVLSGCVSSGKLNYDFEMTHPVQSKEMYFENDTLSIAFEVKPKWIEFTLYNKLNDGIKLSWDEMSLSYNGKAHRVVHKETGISGIREVQPPTTIPPKTKLVDGFITTGQVYYTTRLGYAQPVPEVKNVFPEFYYTKKERDEALKEKGVKITLFMPYYVAGKYVSMYYDLYLKDITISKK